MEAAARRTPGSVPSDPADAGFTLLELLVSLVLIAMLMVAMPAALKFAQRTQTAAVALDQEAALDAAARFIEQRLAEATAIYDRGDDGRLHVIFRGEANAIGFVAPTAFSAREAGLARLDFKLGTDANGHSGLILSWSAWRPPALGEQAPVVAPIQTRLIVDKADVFELRYYGTQPNSEKQDWLETWSRPDTIPDLVEFRIKRPGLAARIRSVPLRLRLP